MEGPNGPDAEDVAGRKAATNLRVLGLCASVQRSRRAAEISAGRRAGDLSACRSPAARRRFVRQGLRRRTAAMTDPLAEGLNELTAALTALGIRFLVGGSLASSAHGVVRATLDGDLVALIFPPHANLLIKALGPGWYADPDTIREAIKNGRSFNLIHVGSAMKFDIFPATTEFHEAQLERATTTPLRVEGAAPCLVATPEDI